MVVTRTRQREVTTPDFVTAHEPARLLSGDCRESGNRYSHAPSSASECRSQGSAPGPDASSGSSGGILRSNRGGIRTKEGQINATRPDNAGTPLIREGGASPTKPSIHTQSTPAGPNSGRTLRGGPVVGRRPHKPKHAGSIPAPATMSPAPYAAATDSRVRRDTSAEVIKPELTPSKREAHPFSGLPTRRGPSSGEQVVSIDGLNDEAPRSGGEKYPATTALAAGRRDSEERGPPAPSAAETLRGRNDRT
jgi:hypothetical protein